MTSEPQSAPATRIEKDSMGEIEVPADALYAAQTARAVVNFPISGQRVPTPIVQALARIKQHAAQVNADLGVIDGPVGAAITAAAKEVVAGDHDEHFPIDVYQTGSGTSTNMNVNEVVARLASDASGLAIHPNDHVNAGQSSNDTFPTALRVVALQLLAEQTEPGLAALEESLRAKSVEFADVVKAGRTHLMDAVPVTLGQEFGGYARQIALGRKRLADAAQDVAELPLGGTATGTGLNAHLDFAPRVISALADDLGLPFTEAVDHFEAQSAQDCLVALSGALKVIAVSLTKLCNDLRWMGSGPRAGLGELALPELQPGSSIMPGKVNPVIPEATLMACARVMGNDTTMTIAGASGSFELNVMLPVMGQTIVESLTLIGNTSPVMADKVIAGLSANVEHNEQLAMSSSAIVTAINSFIGYEAAGAVAKEALREKKTIRETVISRGHVAAGEITEEELDAALDVLSMARAGRS
ncbi:class II fumarate hydratase [Ornithinimicrobium sp. Arc0846-15]|nr:class II fumarate hydratase [Ornithinimicrobium laminariae]